MDRRTLAALALALSVLLAGCVGGLSGSDPGTETTTAGPPPEGTLSVHFVNVGQGEATLLVGPTGETMLVDTGDFKDDGEYVVDYLQRHGIDRIDHLVTTHADADHIGGHAAVIEYLETEGEGVGAVYDPGIPAGTAVYDRYLDAVEEHDVALYRTVEGDDVPFEGVDVAVLGPPQPYVAGEERNENSVVLKVTFGTTAVLLTGDAGKAGERHLVETYGDRLAADVLKAGHHGSDTSTSGPLLDAVDPDAVVVSSAYDSRYGHPHEEVLDRLATRSIPTYWTGVHGDVVFESDGREVTVRSQAPATTDPTSLREFPPVAPGTGGPTGDRDVLDGGSPTVTPAPVPDGGVSVGVEVNADAAGDDRENLNDEYVVLTNRGEEPVDLAGWTVADAVGRTYAIPEGVVLAPGESVTVHTGSGTDTDSDLYWGQGQPVWNNDGDTVIVRNGAGDVVIWEDY